jgi:hypothetical protein
MLKFIPPWIKCTGIFVVGLFVNSVTTINPILNLLGIIPTSANHWITSFIGHFLILIYAIALMLILGGGLRSYGFTLKSSNLLVLPAICIGIVVAVIMAIIDLYFTGNLMAPYISSRINVFGVLSFGWLFVGVAEESLYRGLIQTYLSRTYQGFISIRRFEIPTACIIASFFFATSHFESFFTRPLEGALAQWTYAFVFGIILAILFYKSKSLIAPIIAHNISDGLEYTLDLLMYIKW